MRDIGKNIKTLRTEKSLTQDQLAEMLFVTRQTVSNYETGKSRPDIDMLMKIAEVLETDINAVLYGPAPKPDQSNAIKQLAVGSVGTILLCLLLVIMKDWAMEWYYSYSLAPIYFRNYLVQPVFYLFLGWTLMQGLGILLKAKPLRFPAVVYLRRGLLILLAICLILMLTLLIWSVADTIQLYQAREAGRSYYSSSLSLPPVWNELVRWIAVSLTKFPPIPALFGAALWLFGFPAKTE